jgi:hypothetical protein
MRFRWVFAFVLLAAFGAGAWMVLRPPEAPILPPVNVSVPGSVESARARPEAPAKLAASEVLKIDPRATSARAGVRPVKASAYGDYLSAKQLKPLYDRLKSSPEGQTPEGWYVLYEMLRRCANVTDSKGGRPWVRPIPKRDEFLATLPANDPDREKRVAAFDDLETNRCAGFENLNVTQAEVNKLLADAVSAGDAKARAIAVEQELLAERRGRGFQGASLTDAQIETLRQVIGTRDAGAMVIAGRLLSNTYNDLTIRIGPEGQVVEPRAFMNAWQILACDYGYPCGSDNTRLLSECALQGHCNASTLQDYLFYYGGSPHDSQLVTQYQGILRNAIETGDWSQVAVARGPRPPGSQRMFFFGAGPGRR